MKKICAIATLILSLFVGNATAQEYKFRDHTLTLDERIDDLLSHLTMQEKIMMLSETAPAVERLGIEAYNHGNEALHGIVRPGKFTVFPRPIGLASTFNPEAIKQMADYISNESRARYNELEGKSVGGQFNNMYNGLLTFWSPTVNMARDPRWGRTGETYGEDPHLTSMMGIAFTQGLQGDGKYLKAIATPKHFVANNQETGRFSFNASIPMRSLREYYLQGFEACVTEGKAFSIMAAYNSINGVPCSVNSFLLNDVLRDEWGFEGYVAGDLFSPRFVYLEHHYTSSWAQTAGLLLKSGLDLDSGFRPFGYIAEAIKQGYCTEADLDQAVKRIMMGRFRLGMFDPVELVPYNSISPDVVGAKEHQNLALSLAEQSIIMLKNDGLLPFGDGVKRIALVGPCVDVYKHRQYSAEEGSANPAITPTIAFREMCATKGIELVEIPWAQISGQGEFVAINAESLSVADNASQHGLMGRYYSGVTVDEQHLLGERIDGEIEINRLGKAPDAFVAGQPFTAEWRGKIIAPVAGEYQIRVSFDGDVTAKFDGKELIRGLENGHSQTGIATITLAQGQEVDFELLYTDRSDNAALDLSWIVPISDNREELLSQLADCDAVVMAMGLSTLKTGEGHDKLDLDLPTNQSTFIKDVYGVNKNISLVLMNSTMVNLRWEAGHIPSILELWYPGEQGGRALSNIMWGEVSPSGRLPITFYEDVDHIPSFADYDVTNGRTYMYTRHKPLYEFGYGLSYTTFDYSDLKLDKKSYRASDVIRVSFDVANSGTMDGDEVAQVYVKPVNVQSDIVLPHRQLKGFKRKTIKVGNSEVITIEIPASELNYFCEEVNEFVTYKGDLEIQVGASSEDIRLTQRFKLR